MAIIQKCSNHVGTAQRPRLASIQVGKHRCHHVGISAYPINIGTLLGVIVGHIKHMALKEEIQYKSAMHIKRYSLKSHVSPKPIIYCTLSYMFAWTVLICTTATKQSYFIYLRYMMQRAVCF